MSKTTALAVQNSLSSALFGYKDSAAAVKAAHNAANKQIKDDIRRSEAAKKDDLAALTKETRSKLDGIRADQDSYVKNLRDKVERDLRGNQPADANSVLLRRDASDRTRKITDKREAMDILRDAIGNGDAEMAHAIGTRSRNNGWVDVADAYQAAHPDTANSAEVLACVEANTSGAAFNMSNSITFAAPND